MNKILLLSITFFMTCFLGMFILKFHVTEKENNEKIGVVVTIPPLAEFVEKIGGDKVDVTIMVPPGASPHTYEPTPFQLKKLSKAKMYVKVGSGIEFELAWMDKIASINKKMLIVDCSKGIEFIKHVNNHGKDHTSQKIDPHIWLSIKNVKIMVENIYNGLIHIDPKNLEYYTKNKEKYLQELDKLDKEIRNILSGKNNKKFIVYHPAWTYFARDYGLEQIPIEKEGKEPTSKEIIKLIKYAKENNITLIFTSPQFNTKTAEIIAKEINGKIVFIDPLEKNYLENMRKVAKIFAEVLK